MAEEPRSALFGRRFGRHVWRLIRIYWGSRDSVVALVLLVGAVALELATVYGNLRLSDAERRIFDGVQQKNAMAFLEAIGFFAVFSIAFVVVSAFRVYLRQLVEIRWRRGLTADYVERWMGPRAYAQVQLHGDAIDNPDQRVAEDVRDFVASALGLSLSLLSGVATLVSFGGLLWLLSRDWALPVTRGHLHIPGFMLWVVLVYAALSSWLTHVVGRPLVALNVDRLRYEADFRYGLMRFRDNVEVVTLSDGAALERRTALARFGGIVRNWWELIAAQRRLTMFTGFIGQANGVVPLLVAAPSFFAGLITLGTIAQVRFAYGQVSGALSWFVFAYQEIARWRANVERLSRFTEVMDQTAIDLSHTGIRVVHGPASILHLAHLRLDGPDGATLVNAGDGTVRAGERVAITGPSGAGKTVLLRAIAGIWPFGAGRIDVPASARVLFVPQWPYLPVGALRGVVSYPSPEGTFSDDRIREVLGLLGLERLGACLDETHSWDQRLSPHEQQRIAMARVFLNEPDWVFLDKTTSALDEDMEKRVYDLLQARLPGATVMSVAHRPAVAAYHDRRWTITPNAHGASSLEAA
jgi:vitamin B12/bleomycin/antimicrobial peptide transport system ATP-binding/permease protein